VTRQAWRGEQFVEVRDACRYRASPAGMEAVERLGGRDSGQSICNWVSLREEGAIDWVYVRDEGEVMDASWLAMVERVRWA